MKQRARLRAWLLRTYGDGERVFCVYCGTILSAASMTMDRIVPGSKGGTYRRGNVLPACGPCNVGRGDTAVEMDSCPVCGLAFPLGDPFSRHVARHGGAGTRRSARRRRRRRWPKDG